MDGGRARRWAWRGALTGLLLALLAFAPASWLGMLLGSLSEDKVQLVNTRGSLWSGHGDLLFSGGEGSRGQTSLPEGITWKLRPTWASGPAIKLRLTSPCCTAQPMVVVLRPGLGSLSLRADAFESRWPAAMLVGLGTPWNTLRPDGQLLLQSPGFGVDWHAGRPRLTGQLVVEVHDLATRAATLRPLGSYRLDMQARAEGDEATLTLSTLRGGLQLQGSGQWVGGRLRFRGDAQAAPGNEAALGNLLSIIGRREGKRSLLSFG